MTTKTKPIRKPQPFGVARICLDDSRRNKVAALLECDGDKLDAALAAIDDVLTLGSHMIATRETEPLPAHLLAELEPTLKDAEALADRLNRLQGITRARIGGTGELWIALTDWACVASTEVDRLNKMRVHYLDIAQTEVSPHGSDGGARRQRMRGARNTVDAALQHVYQTAAKTPTGKGEKQFLAIVAPRRRGR